MGGQSSCTQVDAQNQNQNVGVAKLGGKAAFHPSAAHRLYRNKLLVLEARRKLKCMSKPSGVPLAGTSPACGMLRGQSGISFKVCV